MMATLNNVCLSLANNNKSIKAGKQTYCYIMVSCRMFYKHSVLQDVLYHGVLQDVLYHGVLQHVLYHVVLQDVL